MFHNVEKLAELKINIARGCIMRMRAFVSTFVCCRVGILPLPTMKQAIYQVFVILSFHKSPSFASLKHRNIINP